MEKVEKAASFRSIAIRLTALVMGLWLTFMAVLTWAVAADFYRQLHDMTNYIAGQNWRVHYNDSLPDDLPGTVEVDRIKLLGDCYFLLDPEQLLPIVHPQTPNGYGSDDWFYGNWDLLYGFEPAVILYGENQEDILVKSGDYLTFAYTSEENWKAEDTTIIGKGYVNLDELESGADTITGWFWGSPRFCSTIGPFVKVLRMTGYFEGSEFIPATIDRGDSPIYVTDDSPETLSRLDARDNLEWENIVTRELPEGQALQTIYTWEAGGFDYESNSVTVNGTTFDSLADLLQADHAGGDYERESLLDSVIVAYGTHEDSSGGYVYALAVRCWPLEYALWRLIPVYLISFAAVGLSLWLILRKIKNSLTRPLSRLIAYYVKDDPITPGAAWKEPYALESLAAGAQQQRRALINENQQLRTALDYARNAEENRRQMVSNITHELKTPLAIIHSYAEGLQAGIAEEKKEKYLRVILEEAERMDGMVLEMLDLSRLEAGKVRLSADHFSLLELTQSIAEKLTPAAQAKEVEILYSFTEACMLTADESRITQVITNLTTNAIKYTAPGGTIWIRVFADKDNAHFYMENTSPHLPDDVLDKIFDTFYRTDLSRTEKGTGLGLPIARSIIELHRGTLTARNTWINGKPCVEFHFTIPLV